jgi:predicted ester cyclase
VAIRESYQGTHTGEFQGLAPTGRVVRFTSTDIYRIVDGKIVEVWTELDALGMMQQLGAIPGPAQAT